ncbi:hypothetical protein QJS04_geneDACA012220 [Acorus gramineus]|uniref:Uncharacterized protein n=1 Tax=Acorus gramineus TaxID=55184 RepID=A0AAV9BAU7_ACOGR|nr:hypothetical protein QJS04_geneDACA012220 [Acorus gramineus]
MTYTRRLGTETSWPFNRCASQIPSPSIPETDTLAPRILFFFFFNVRIKLCFTDARYFNFFP